MNQIDQIKFLLNIKYPNYKFHCNYIWPTGKCFIVAKDITSSIAQGRASIAANEQSAWQAALDQNWLWRNVYV